MANEDEWKNSIRRNYSYFKNNIADPLDVAEYLFGETNPPIITDNQKEQIKVYHGNSPQNQHQNGYYMTMICANTEFDIHLIYNVEFFFSSPGP